MCVCVCGVCVNVLVDHRPRMHTHRTKLRTLIYSYLVVFCYCFPTGTYRPYDHLDEIAAAYSVAFTPDGSRILAGFKDCVRVFDVTRPGRV